MVIKRRMHSVVHKPLPTTSIVSDSEKDKKTETINIEEKTNIEKEKEVVTKKKVRFGGGVSKKENSVPEVKTPVSKDIIKDKNNIIICGFVYNIGDGRYGKEKWPPETGSSYFEFLDWATNQNEFFESITAEDELLAYCLFNSLLPHPGKKPDDFVETVKSEHNEEIEDDYRFGF